MRVETRLNVLQGTWLLWYSGSALMQPQRRLLQDVGWVWNGIGDIGRLATGLVVCLVAEYRRACVGSRRQGGEGSQPCELRRCIALLLHSTVDRVKCSPVWLHGSFLLRKSGSCDPKPVPRRPQQQLRASPCCHNSILGKRRFPFHRRLPSILVDVEPWRTRLTCHATQMRAGQG